MRGKKMLNDIENTLIEKIKAIYPNLDVTSFPLDFERYDFTNHDGCALVKYQGSTFSQQNTVWEVSQDETYEYKILLGLRYLRTFQEANPVISNLKKILQGLLIVNHKVTLKMIKFEGVDNGDLWFSITINLKLLTYNRKEYQGGADLPV